MRKQNLIGWSTALILMSSWPAQACGDKLLVLGQGLYFQIQPSKFQSAVIFYMGDAPGSEKWTDTELKRIFEAAGHSYKSVRGLAALETALKSHHYSLVIADFSDAPAMEELIKKTTSKAVVLPWVYEEPDASKAEKAALKRERDAAEKQYRFVLERSTPKNLMSRVEYTLEWRAQLPGRVQKT